MFVPILAYHKIQNKFDFGLTFITPATFERQIRHLYSNGFKGISIFEYLTCDVIPEKCVIITFDDAYGSVFENAFPILERYHYKATIFVITGYIGRRNLWDYSPKRTTHCGWEELRVLAGAGWEIGSHTVNHANLTSLSDNAIWFELKNSKEFLESHLQIPVNIVSYPFGKHNRRVIQLAREAGYKGACTLGCNFPNQSSAFALFRRGVYFMEPLSLFRLKLYNNRLARLDDVKQKAFTFCSNGTQLLQALRTPAHHM